MSILCFNRHGLGKAQIVINLCVLLQRYSPKVVFISEIKNNAMEMAAVKDQVSDYGAIYIDALGRLEVWQYFRFER